MIIVIEAKLAWTFLELKWSKTFDLLRAIQLNHEGSALKERLPNPSQLLWGARGIVDIASKNVVTRAN